MTLIFIKKEPGRRLEACIMKHTRSGMERTIPFLSSNSTKWLEEIVLLMPFLWGAVDASHKSGVPTPRPPCHHVA